MFPAPHKSREPVPAPGPWNGWYHAIATCYGTWLRGDPRGWRSRRHREHVEGDYQNPPPAGTYAIEFRRSRQQLAHAPMRFPPDVREVVRDALADRLGDFDTEVVALAVAATHAHAVVRFVNRGVRGSVDVPGLAAANALRDGRDPVPRHVFGVAMKHASHVLREADLKRPGPVWAKRAKFVPVADRAHQLAATRYVVAHALREGAALHTMWGFVPAGLLQERDRWRLAGPQSRGIAIPRLCEPQ